jgi:hypothetical protein
MERALSDLSRRITVSALAVAVVAGSAFLWIGIPWLGLWLAGRLTVDNQGFLFFALLAVPVAMLAFGWVLYRVNAVYERAAGRDPAQAGDRARWLGSLSGEREQFRRARAPRALVDVAMTASAVTAMCLLVVWFFFFASSPLGPMQ